MADVSFDLAATYTSFFFRGCLLFASLLRGQKGSYRYENKTSFDVR